MNRQATTEEGDEAAQASLEIPGLVQILHGGRGAMQAFACGDAPIAIGREVERGVSLEDARASRRHAEVLYTGSQWTVRDLDSRNGTFVDGVRVEGSRACRHDAVIRVGASLLVTRRDVRPFLHGRVESTDDRIAGPVLRAALGRIETAARSGRGVLVIAESGVGKELAARAFHRATSRAKGPFVAVNCAAIPEGVAERLLFGATKGAYSGANADSTGYLEAADGGTLFLDEMGELDLAVQAKLLRVLETREVLPLGALRPRPIDIRLCCATHRDLRRAVADGRFRADLYYRIAQPEVHLPPLRERAEEIPWFVERELAQIDPKLSADARFHEACVLRPWPGNVRELLATVREAAHEALAAKATVVTPDWLPVHAGLEIRTEIPDAPRESHPQGESPFTREALEAALARHKHNVAATARELGLHRTQLYRYLQRFGIAARPDGT